MGAVLATLQDAPNELMLSVPLSRLGVYGQLVALFHDHKEFDHPGRVGGELPWLVRALPFFGVRNGVCLLYTSDAADE